MIRRRIVGNLDFERAIAATDGRAPRRLSPAAARHATLLGTLLRVFATAGDRLWLPGPLPPGRVPEVRGVPTPEHETGDLRRSEPAAEWLAWGETESIAALRSDRNGSPPPEADRDEPLWERVWRLPRTVPAVARHFHHRQTHAILAKELDLSLPGQRWISNIETLEEHLSEGGAALSSGERWILKPAYSAAGRDWLRGEGAQIPPAVRTAMEKALAGGGAFLFEPRLDRVRDVGVSLAIWDHGVEIIGRHELVNAPNGRFLAARPLPPAGEGARDAFADRVVSAALRVGERLIALGYRGACGIDAWLGRDASGSDCPQLLSEINARLTFGWLAHAWRSRLAAAGAISPTSPVALRTSDESAPPPGAISLLSPGESDALAAWLEIADSATSGGLAAGVGTR